jgi:hypothetical protein
VVVWAFEPVSGPAFACRHTIHRRRRRRSLSALKPAGHSFAFHHRRRQAAIRTTERFSAARAAPIPKGRRAQAARHRTAVGGYPFPDVGGFSSVSHSARSRGSSARSPLSPRRRLLLAPSVRHHSLTAGPHRCPTAAPVAAPATTTLMAHGRLLEQSGEPAARRTDEPLGPTYQSD